MQVEVKVLFFAKAGELAGFKKNTITVPTKQTYNQLLHFLVKSFNLQPIQSNIIIALNEEYCCKTDNISLKQGDTIAIIPPLSEKIYDLVLAPDSGAVSMFVGTTRDSFESKSVKSLEYEAYESMGFKAMKQVCLDLRKQWPDVRNIAIYHRLGPVPVKEASIVIAISSPHRADAIKAVEWCIDNVKKSVPIFKKEVYSDGDSQWKENAELLPKVDKLPKLTNCIDPEVIITHLPRHLVQVKATNAEINVRIEKFMERKRCEINLNNIRDFCFRDANVDMGYSCARIDSKILKRKDSKGYLEVDRVYNNYVRDQDNFDFLLKFITKDGLNERVTNLESQLNMSTPVLPTVYKRIKNLEDRLLHLESISPEYAKFSDTRSRNTKSKKRKTVFSVDDINSFISELEKQSLH